MKLEKFSIGIGDRFGREGVAQLAALQKAEAKGVQIVPVWNKSNREHNLIGSTPKDTRLAAESAVNSVGWKRSFYLDADHIGLKTVDRFLAHCNFYTIDVADFIGQPASEQDRAVVRASLLPLLGRSFPALGQESPIDRDTISKFLDLYTSAVREAGRIYHHIVTGRGPFIAEVSTDEAETPQTPVELLLILGALANEGVRVQTIAPKFSGRFNKGVDYVGDVACFSREFAHDLAAIRLAVVEFGLPDNLKISIHSGSDKFSLYGPIRKLLCDHDAGLHIKTAGTTWLEEVIGLALAGGDCLAIAKDIYTQAYARIDELCLPYATVIDINRSLLPSPSDLRLWEGADLASALRHDQSNCQYNASMRQLVHVSFKVAAEMGSIYLESLDVARETISNCVTNNLYERHIRPLFIY